MGSNWRVACTINGNRAILSVTNGADTKAGVAAAIRTDPKITQIEVFGPAVLDKADKTLAIDELRDLVGHARG